MRTDEFLRRRSRLQLLGVPIDALDTEQMVQAVSDIIAARRPAQHVAMNAAKYVAAWKDKALAEIIATCDLINADGQSVVWAARLLGLRLPERVAGVDLFQRLIEEAARRGWRPYFLGAEPDVVSEVVRRLRARHPELQVAGYRDGYWNADEEADVIHGVRDANADLLFLAIPSPRKEFWLHEHLNELGVPFVMGVGGTFDVTAGRVARAPRFVQRFGFEWLYRLLQEPRRMFKRYLIGNTTFLYGVARAKIGDRERNPLGVRTRCGSFTYGDTHVRPVVVHVGPALAASGGIASVMRTFGASEISRRYRLRWITTCGDERGWPAVSRAVLGLLRVVATAASPRASLFHLHVASRGSFIRKACAAAIVTVFRKPYVVHLHGARFDAYAAGGSCVRRRAIAAVFNRARVVIALSEQWAEHIRTFSAPQRVEVLPNPVVVPDMADQVQLDPAMVVFLGRLGDRKGTPELLSAIRLLQERGVAARYVLAGDGDVDAFRAEANRLPCPTDVEIPGWVDGTNAMRLLDAAGVFCLPSRAEGKPVALLEAMARGLACVATPVGGIPEVVVDDVNGLLVAPGDAVALAAALETCLVDPAERDRLGQAARKTVAAQYDVDIVAERLSALYDDVMSCRR